MTWTPPRDYWSVDTGSGHYCVSEDEARKVIVALNKGNRMARIVDIYGGEVFLVLSHVESVCEVTAEVRERSRAMRQMWDDENEEEAWK